MLEPLNSTPTHYSKPTWLIERAATHPSAVIKEVFAEVLSEELTDDLLLTGLR